MYTAIYRDFRPDSFDRLVGQDHIVRILKGQIASGRTGHAYLFCGTRGTGKTTTARILAKALNCEADDMSARPCCTCASCRAIKEGRFIDVTEIDAASNNGVDNIRELRESVNYPPVQGRCKVYIIDEVHMLSTGAFNALLKTLEEPPENVVFILATTEPRKLPATILSRCMRLDFRRVSEKTIKENMKMICDARGITVDDAALSLIAVNADGSVRDSLSILEQCISSGESHVTRDDVAGMLGTAGEEMMIELTDCVMQSDISSALLLLDSAVNRGCDVKQFMRDWLVHFRNLLMARYIENPENALNMSLENAARVKEQSMAVSEDMLDRGITELTKTISESRWSNQPRVMLEMCIVRLGTPHTADVHRQSVPEREVREKEVSAAAPAAPSEAGAMSDGDRYLQSLIESGAAGGAEKSPETPAFEGGSEVTSAVLDEVHSREPSESLNGAPSATESARPGLTAEQLELWTTVVRKAVGEKPMLIRIENRAKLIGMDDTSFYVGVQDDVTAKIIKEKGRDILEKKMEEYCGRHLTLRLAKQKGVPLRKERDEAEEIAGRIKEKFNIDIEIK